MQEFDECIRKILQMNYGLIIISHATDKTFKDMNNQEYNQIIPTLDNRARLVCERTCDIIGYARAIDLPEGGKKTKLFLRGTPRFVAGSRFRYTPDNIDFNYDSLVKAIGDAIDKEAENGGLVKEERESLHKEEVSYDFNQLLNEFNEIVTELMNADQGNASKISKIVEKHLGAGKKVNQCNRSESDKIALIITDLKVLK